MRRNIFKIVNFQHKFCFLPRMLGPIELESWKKKLCRKFSETGLIFFPHSHEEHRTLVSDSWLNLQFIYSSIQPLSICWRICVEVNVPEYLHFYKLYISLYALPVPVPKTVSAIVTARVTRTTVLYDLPVNVISFCFCWCFHVVNKMYLWGCEISRDKIW